MNLPSSLFVSCVIVAVIWFGVAYQPRQESYGYPDSEPLAAAEPVAIAPVALAVAPAVAASAAQTIAEEAPAAGPAKPVKASSDEVSGFKRFQSIDIVGITQEINIDGVDAMWAEFGNRSDLHNRLSKMTATNYVLYRNFNQDFSRAKITIGYDSADLNSLGKDVVSAPDGRYRVVREPDRYSQQELLDSWTLIDFQKPVEAVLERHVLNASAQVVSSSIYVLYR